MKNNALKLISLAVLAPMMMACPKQNKAKPIWSEEIDKAMIMYAGEVLPYAEFDKETIQYGYDDTYSMFYLYDDNETNVLENYAETLIAAGYEEVEEDFMGVTYITYDKTNDLGLISVSFGYDEGDAESETLPGNFINVTVPQYIDEDVLAVSGYVKQQGWPAQLVASTLEGSGITMSPVNANGEWWVDDELYEDPDDGSAYYCAYLVTVGDFFDAISTDLTGQGLTYDESYGCFYDMTWATDAEIYVSVIRGYTVLSVYGQTLLPDVASETINQDGSIDVSFTFADALENSTAYEGFDSTSASLVLSKGSNDNAPTFYSNNNTLRFYAKNTITITAATGLTINSVTIEIGSLKTLKPSDMSASSGSVSASATSAPATVTISNVNANSLTITVGPNASGGNLGFSSITVNVSSAL